MPRMTKEQKAAEIKRLRESGMSDAEIIAEHSVLQAGYVWLKENPSSDAKVEQPKRPVGSGSMPATMQTAKGYAAEFRTPKLV